MEASMKQQIVVFGFGPVGRAATEAVIKHGYPVKVVARSKPTSLPNDATFESGDVLDANAVRNVVVGASQIVVAIGFPYDGQIWRGSWPKAMANLVAACEDVGARMVFVDNLYMYGPQHDPLREDMTLTNLGVKPAARAEATRIWTAAINAGNVRVAALRAPDFYGPGVAQSQLGDRAFGALAKGKRA
jgi:nucleoside-diphosphate-sugar epimerase